MFYLKVGFGLLLIAALGALPAWAIDRWLVRLAPVVYLALSLVGIVGLLKFVDFDRRVRQWREDRGPIRH